MYRPNSMPANQHSAQKRTSSYAPKDAKYHQALTQPINNMVLYGGKLPSQYEASQEEGQMIQYEQQNQGSPYSYNYDPQKYQVHPTLLQKPSSQQQQVNNKPNPHTYQHSHSLGRELQGMGLITQVKKGETVPTVLPSGLSPAVVNHANKHQQLQSYNEDDQGGLRMDDPMMPLLKPQRSDVKGRKTLVLDLDETLVHSSFKAPTGREPPADIVLPVDIEGRVCHVYVLVRPGCLKFLSEMSKYYEVVIFTASLSKYADPLMDIIDQKGIAPQRLFREHCTFHDQSGVFVKDMARLGRPLTDVFIIDNSPLSYGFQPENGMPILSWYDDRLDTKLIELIPVLKLLSEVPDVRPVLRACCSRDNVYLTDKSIVMCTRILDEQALRLERPPFTPKQNQWILSPPQVAHIDSTPVSGSPSSHSRSKRNHNDALAQSSTTPLNYQKNQFSLTQASSKKNLLTQTTIPVGGATPTKLQQFKTIDDEKQSNKTMIHNQNRTIDDVSRSVESASKKRPKTANRHPSIPKSQSQNRTKIDIARSPITVSLNHEQAFKKTVQSIMNATKQQSITQAQTPQSPHRLSYHTQKSETKKQASTAPKPPQSKTVRPVTTHNSTRNSTERMLYTTAGLPHPPQLQLTSSAQKASRAGSARKKPTTFSEQDLTLISGGGSKSSTPHASKNLSKLAVASKQSQQRSSSNVKQALETPPTKVSGSILSKLITYQPVQNPAHQYSSTKKTTKHHSPPKRLSQSPSSKVREGSVTGGKSPGKIFSTVQAVSSPSQQMQFSQQFGSQQGYSNLMKNLAPQFKGMSTPAKNKPSSAAIITGGNVKGVRLVSNQAAVNAAGGSSLLVAKFNQTLTSTNHTSGNHTFILQQTLQEKGMLDLGGANTATSTKQVQGTNAQVEAPSTNTSDTQINSMLNEFEKTKNFNKELLLMRNIGSPKQPLSSYQLLQR